MNTQNSQSEESHQPYKITRLMPPNFDYLYDTKPHRLYRANNGDWMEFFIQRATDGPVSERRIILGVRYSSKKGPGHLFTYLITEDEQIIFIDDQGGLRESFIEVEVLYLLLNPLPKFGSWNLQDIGARKQENLYLHERGEAERASWEYTNTFHPDLEEMMERVKIRIEDTF